MKYNFSIIKTQHFYIIIIIISFVFWFLLNAPTYQSSLILSVETLESQSPTFSSYLSEYYHPSMTGNHLLAVWLQSESAYERLGQRVNMRSIYKKGDSISKFGSVYDVFMKGDRAEWSYFKRHLSVNIDDRGNIVHINFTSFDPKDSQAILETLLLLGQHYLKKSHQQEDEAKRAYIHSLSDQLSDSIKNIDKDINHYIENNISIYPKESYLNSLTLQNSMHRKLLDLSSALTPFNNIDTKSPIKKSLLLQKENIQLELMQAIHQNIDKLKQYKAIEDLLQQRIFLSGLYKTVQEKDYRLKRDIYMDRYKVNVISPPSYFAERSGPHRLKGFFLSFLIISLIYWLIKD